MSAEWSKLSIAAKQLEFQLRDEKMATAELSAAMKELRTQLEREVERNLDIGTELLTLVNQKELLQHQCREMERQVNDLTIKLKACTDVIQGIQISFTLLDLKTSSTHFEL